MSERSQVAKFQRAGGTSKLSVMVRSARAEDAAAIAEIYNHYVRETIVTFEEEPVGAEEMAETTVYVDRAHHGRGLGTLLYQALIEELRDAGIHSLLGGIALPNPASTALHEKLGFEVVAQLREVGWKFDKWIDVGYWELLL